MVRFTERDIVAAPGGMQAQYLRKMVEEAFFKEHGLVVTRWIHDYDSLGGSDPALGLVYLRGDSVVTEYMEVWGLLGHNLRGPDETA